MEKSKMKTEISQPSWERQKTTKLYLHPPRSERMVTFWPDFKVVNSPIKRELRQGARAFGFIILAGDPAQPLCWQNSAFSVREDGIPIPAINQSEADFDLTMEAFCDTDRAPAVYVRLTVRNLRPWSIEGRLSVIPRTGAETNMMGINSDGYCSYEPTLETWGMLPCDWALKDKAIQSPEYFLAFESKQPFTLEWDRGKSTDSLHKRNLCHIHFSLEQGDSLTLDLLLDKGSLRPFNYDKEKQRTEEFWKSELGKITHFPKSNTAAYRTMFLHQIAQMMQMVVRHEGEDYTAVIQGGISRGIWPLEAVELLLGLDLAGLHEYSYEVYQFFKTSQKKEGDDIGNFPSMVVQPWANNTGGILWGLSQHLRICKSRTRFEEFRSALLEGFEWIRRTRLKHASGGEKGLFPPMRASDWGGEAQSWCWTDAWNVMGLEELSKTLKEFGDSAHECVLKEAQDYRDVMEKLLEDIVSKHTAKPEILITNRIGFAPTDPPNGPYFADGPSNLIRMGLIKPDSRTFNQVERFFRNRNLMQRGLCGLMTDSLLRSGHAADRWAGHTWYTTLSELPWFQAWLQSGQFEKAEETFRALIRYAMSSEYYLSERYADNDPTFSPWQPNASGSGRFVLMMYEYFEAKSARECESKDA